MSLVELEARAAELASRQEVLGLQIKRARRELARESLKPCTPWMRGVAMRLLCVSDFDVSVVGKYLERKRRRETAEDVIAWTEDLPEERLAQLDEATDDMASNRQLAEARKFMQEDWLASWVQEQNETKGLAPSAKAVLEAAGPSVAQGRFQDNRYRWVRRFMGRWGGKRVRLSGGDSLSDEELHRKVGAQ